MCTWRCWIQVLTNLLLMMKPKASLIQHHSLTDIKGNIKFDLTSVPHQCSSDTVVSVCARYLCLISGMLMQLAAATAANGTNRPIRGEMCCKEFREDKRGRLRKIRRRCSGSLSWSWRCWICNKATQKIRDKMLTGEHDPVNNTHTHTSPPLTKRPFLHVHTPVWLRGGG